MPSHLNRTPLNPDQVQHTIASKGRIRTCSCDPMNKEDLKKLDSATCGSYSMLWTGIFTPCQVTDGYRAMCHCHVDVQISPNDRSTHMQTLWAIDKVFDAKTGKPTTCQFPFDTSMHAYGATKITQAVSVQELAEGEAHVLRLCYMTMKLLSLLQRSHCIDFKARACKSSTDRDLHRSAPTQGMRDWHIQAFCKPQLICLMWTGPKLTSLQTKDIMSNTSMCCLDTVLTRAKGSQFCAALWEKDRTGKDPDWGQLPEEGEIDLLHVSPPCQELSSLNQHTDYLKAERVLFPILDAVSSSSQQCQ